MGVAIDIDNVVKMYDEHTVIDGLSLTIQPGELFTLLGPSGCGKRRSCEVIIGFNSVDGGAIKVDGQRINDVPVQAENGDGV